MDVLKTLFEQHFHSPPTRVQPLQGDLGGSGRKITRLANDKVSAIGILYGGRESFAPAAIASLKKYNVPILVSMKWPEKARDTDPDEEQPEEPHGQVGDGAWRARRLLDEARPARDDDQPIEVEERGPRAPDVFDQEAGVLEHGPQAGAREVATVTQVAVVVGHRPAGYGDDQAGARREVRLHVLEEARGLVDVLEHLGADDDRCPAPEGRVRALRLEQVGNEEGRVGHLPARDLDPGSALLQAEELARREAAAQGLREVAGPGADVEQAQRRRRASAAAQVEEHESTPEVLRGVAACRLLILLPVVVPLVGQGGNVRRLRGHSDRHLRATAKRLRPNLW